MVFDKLIDNNKSIVLHLIMNMQMFLHLKIKVKEL